MDRRSWVRPTSTRSAQSLTAGKSQRREQPAALLTAGGRIAAATCRITSDHAGYMIFPIWDDFKVAPSPRGIRVPTWNVIPSAYPSSYPKRHLDRFVCFCRVRGCEQETHTEHATSVAIGGVYPMRHNNTVATIAFAISPSPCARDEHGSGKPVGWIGSRRVESNC